MNRPDWSVGAYNYDTGVEISNVSPAALFLCCWSGGTWHGMSGSHCGLDRGGKLGDRSEAEILDMSGDADLGLPDLRRRSSPLCTAGTSWRMGSTHPLTGLLMDWLETSLILMYVPGSGDTDIATRVY